MTAPDERGATVDDGADRLGHSVRLHARDHWTGPEHALGPRHDTLRTAITEELDRLAG